MADLIHEAHKTITDIEANTHVHTSVEEKLKIAQIKVLIAIAQGLEALKP